MKTKPPFKMTAEEARLWAQLDPEALPRHVAIILDGNGRWARRRHQPRIAGHRAGVRAVREIVEFCARMHLPVLTLFAFSLDNWKRPREEVDFLMQLLRQYVRRELDYMRRNNVRLRVIGRWRELPGEVRRDVAQALESTEKNTGLQVVVALNYSARAEIVDAVRRFLERHQQNGHLPIDEAALSAHLDAGDLPDPDLLIRTSGEMRLSNFLLWQMAYTEIWVTETLWPDFTPRHLLQAFLDFQRRERRYGGLSPEARQGTVGHSARHAQLSRR
ncbi:MAG TPA: isoprenyl transferase [Candidatus Xenobia bacterium]|nr:isoprenyl transferase [Candidatus Xenobia bacterium]